MDIFKDENNNVYHITVIETLKKKVIVQADSEEDALTKVEEAYNKCEIILDENDFTDVKFKVKKVVPNEEDIVEEENQLKNLKNYIKIYI